MTTSIENSIINNPSDCDGDHSCIQLYNGTIRVDTKKFKKGNKIPCAAFLYDTSKLQLFNEEDALRGTPTEELSLLLTIVK